MNTLLLYYFFVFSKTFVLPFFFFNVPCEESFSRKLLVSGLFLLNGGIECCNSFGYSKSHTLHFCCINHYKASLEFDVRVHYEMFVIITVESHFFTFVSHGLVSFRQRISHRDFIACYDKWRRKKCLSGFSTVLHCFSRLFYQKLKLRT